MNRLPEVALITNDRELARQLRPLVVPVADVSQFDDRAAIAALSSAQFDAALIDGALPGPVVKAVAGVFLLHNPAARLAVLGGPAADGGSAAYLAGARVDLLPVVPDHVGRWCRAVIEEATLAASRE